jgi:hypothetical protein
MCNDSAETKTSPLPWFRAVVVLPYVTPVTEKPPRDRFDSADGSTPSSAAVPNWRCHLVCPAGDIAADPQFAALGTIETVDDDELGPLRMQNVLFRMSRTPGTIRWAGRPHGADTDAVLAELSLDNDEIARLRAAGVIR